MDLTPISNEAARRLDCPAECLEWFSWPETFASTAGPRGGIGGQMISTFQVFAFAHPSEEKAIKCCSGIWKPWDRVICSSW